MQVTYDGAHSVIFGDKHSWDDWHLIPSSRPVISPPKVNTKTIEIPGSNGVKDLSDFPLGFATYGNRSGSLTFYVDTSRDDWDWDIAYGEIMGYLHGFQNSLTLTDDQSYYYVGRFSVDSFKSDKLCSSITIKYDLQPFKLMRWSTRGDWLWNPFDFKYGLLIEKNDFILQADSEDWVTVATWDSDHVGFMPVTPVIDVVVSGITEYAGLWFRYKNVNQNDSLSIDRDYHEFLLKSGLNDEPQIMFATPRPGDKVEIQLKGHGFAAFDYVPGRL